MYIYGVYTCMGYVYILGMYVDGVCTSRGMYIYGVCTCMGYVHIRGMYKVCHICGLSLFSDSIKLKSSLRHLIKKYCVFVVLSN